MYVFINLFIKDEKEFTIQSCFDHGSTNIIKVIDSLHVENKEKGFDYFVIFLEYANSGTLSSFLNLKSRTNPGNKIFPTNPLSEEKLNDYFSQLRFLFLIFC
jgi:serine/threonine protein kinase